MQLPKKYEYQPKILISIIAIIFFGLIAILFVNQALYNNKPILFTLLNYSLFSLSIKQAQIFHWLLATTSFLMSLLGIVLLIIRLFFKKKFIILTGNTIPIPKNIFSDKVTVLHFSDIHSIRITQQLAYFYHPLGKTVLSSSFLPNKKAFTEIIDFIAKKIE